MNLQQLCLIEDKLKKLQLRSSDIMMLASVWDDDAELGRIIKMILERSIKRPPLAHADRRVAEY